LVTSTKLSYVEPAWLVILRLVLKVNVAGYAVRLLYI